jgi:O-antigen ligase
MNSGGPLKFVGIVLGLSASLFLVFHYLQYFGDITFLGGVLLLEIIIACLWNYDRYFFVFLVTAFAWAGMHLPLESSWTIARWVVLGAGAVAGFIIWTKAPRRPFGSLHLIAFFCVCAAFVSATVSSFAQMATLKALSLSLLFLYCSTGARLAVLRREEKFFAGLLLGSELLVYFTAICYFGGLSVWGNPNSLGAVMSIAVFPFLLWGWFTTDGPIVKFRRLTALLLCTYLVLFSMARAGMVSLAMVTVAFCFCLRQYRLLLKVMATVLAGIAITGMLYPDTLDNQISGFEDALLYKGHKDEGILGSRRTPWEQTINTIKLHPLFGTGYGTSPTGEDPGLDFGKVASSSETAREHGSSYMTIIEWVGLLGVLPFIMLIGVTLSNLWKTCAWMRRTADARSYSVPLAMMVLAGMVHAGFEDWLFAVGYYLCVYFWFFAFILADLVPEPVESPVAQFVTRVPHPLSANLGAVVPDHVMRNSAAHNR